MIGNICRAKRIDNNKWVDGYYVFDKQHLIVKDLQCVVRGLTEFLHVYPVVGETIGRAVGQKDKNGKEVFESDIIKYFGDQKFVVKYGPYNKHVGLGYYHGIGFYLEKVGNAEFQIPFDAEMCGAYEVIGNVHDNEELLCVE